MAVPETRQVSGVPEVVRPELDGAPGAGTGDTRTADSGPVDIGLSGSQFLRWGQDCVTALERARAEIDGLNVFPVPDSDTGRNLLATMRAAMAAAAVPVAATGGPGYDRPAERPMVDTAGRGTGAASGGKTERDTGGKFGIAAGEAAGRDAGRKIGAEAGETAGTDSDGKFGAAGGRGATGAMIEEAADARKERAQVHRYAAAMAYGATSGARGNSGIILSQVLRGIAEATVDRGLTGDGYRAGLARAAVLVRDSLSEPVEGTILTVLDRASGAAGSCAGSGLAEVARAAAEGAARALDETRDQLAVLRAAGVVDAGARGLLVLLDTMVEVVTGEPPVRRAYLPANGMPRSGGAQRVAEAMRYEVMFRVAAADENSADVLRSRLAELGDSVVVAADGAGGWAAHVHCAQAGAAVEAGLAAGVVRNIRIEFLAESRIVADPVGTDQMGRCAVGEISLAAISAAGAATVPAEAGVAEPGSRDTAWPDAVGRGVTVAAASTGGRGSYSADDGSAVDRGVLAVAAGAGATGLFEAAGAVVLDAERALESAALLAAIRAMPHREVLVLPNGALPAHELVAVGVAARDAHRDVLLLPSASMVQGLAALAVHDRARIAVDDAFAMSEAAASTRWGALRRAGERALTMVGTCSPGDGLGLVGHDVVVIDRDARAAGHTLLDRMLGLGGELVTLLVGAEAPDGLAADLARHIGTEFPGVEVSVYSGGQRGDLIQIGVE